MRAVGGSRGHGTHLPRQRRNGTTVSEDDAVKYGGQITARRGSETAPTPLSFAGLEGRPAANSLARRRCRARPGTVALIFGAADLPPCEHLSQRGAWQFVVEICSSCSRLFVVRLGAQTFSWDDRYSGWSRRYRDPD
jgi:hypothetical protein